jgi:putative transposase
LIIQRAVEEEFDAFLGRERYERRADALPGKSNGYRLRHLQTAEGELEIEIPQLREAAETFVSKLFPRESKRLITTEPLKTLVIGVFVRGPLDARRRGALRRGWARPGELRPRRGSAPSCASATRRSGSVTSRRSSSSRSTWTRSTCPCDPTGVKEGILCAWGFHRDGKRVLLDVCLGQRESEEYWLEFGRGLTARGLRSPLLVIADGASGLVNAINALWPAADRQRCTVRRLRNLLAKVPEEQQQQELRMRYWSALDEATRQGSVRCSV